MCSDNTCQQGQAGTQEILFKHKEKNSSQRRWSDTETGAQKGCGVFVFGDTENLTGGGPEKTSHTMKLAQLWTGVGPEDI